MAFFAAFVRRGRYDVMQRAAMAWKLKLRERTTELIALREKLARIEAEAGRTQAELERERARSAELQAKLERFEDDSLFAAGYRPIHHPEAPQYQPRQVSEQELSNFGVTSPWDWREVQARLEKEAEGLAEREIQIEAEALAKKFGGHGQA